MGTLLVAAMYDHGLIRLWGPERSPAARPARFHGRRRRSRPVTILLPGFFAAYQWVGQVAVLGIQSGFG